MNGRPRSKTIQKLDGETKPNQIRTIPPYPSRHPSRSENLYDTPTADSRIQVSFRLHVNWRTRKKVAGMARWPPEDLEWARFIRDKRNVSSSPVRMANLPLFE